MYIRAAPRLTQCQVANDKNKTVLDSKLKLTDKPEETEVSASCVSFSASHTVWCL